MEINIQRNASNAATSTYALMYSQQIVDHFMKALEDNGCMVQFPVGLYIEFDNYQNQLEEYITAAINSEDTNTGNEETWPGEQSAQQSPTLTDEIVRQALKSVSDNCFNCKIEKPKFDFSNMFGRLLKDASAALDEWKNMFKFRKASVCQYAFFLSYLCVPDLLKLLAMILAAIVRLLQNINLPRITVALFIQGILSAIIEALVKNISILARFALTPVLCILDAIEEIIESLPTPENIRRSSAADLERLGLTEYIQGDTKIREDLDGVRKAYTKRINDYEKGGHDSVKTYGKEVFEPLKNTINQSIESLNDSISELLGLLNHYQCEPSRSGVSVSQFLSNASELMALANLLRYTVQFKAGKAAMDKLCNAPTDGSGWGDSNTLDSALTVENIGSVIAGVIGSDVDIITDDEGDPIGVVIKNPEYEENPNNLSFWSCNIKDFTDGININNIITNYVNDNIDKIDSPDKILDDWSVNIVPKSKYDAATDSANTPIIPLVIDEVWNIPSHIKEIVKTFELYNPTTDGNIITDIEFLPENVINELMEKTGVTSSLRTIPRLEVMNPSDNKFGSNIPTITIDAKDISKLPQSEIQDGVEKVISGNRTDSTSTSEVLVGSQGSINLECGTPEGILSKLGDI